MKCKICKSLTRNIFKAKVLNKYDVDFLKCGYCGFLQTEEPFWLKEAYESPINITDTGILQRNIYLSRKVSPLLYFYFNRKEKFLDYSGGYGIFTRLMRDIGFDFYWNDPFTPNLFARGFELSNEINFEAITSFESFEHFEFPLTEMEKILSISKNVIFTTVLTPEPMPEPENWWYYGFEHGQHIAFYASKTLEYIAGKFGLNFYSDGTLHLFTSKKLNKFILMNFLRLTDKNLMPVKLIKLKSKTSSDSGLLINRTKTFE